MIGHTKRQVQAYSWSKDGWKLSNKEITIPNKTSYQQTDFDFFNTNDISIIQQVDQQIQVGDVFEAMDELPSSMKQIISSPDTWYIGGGKLFKVVDPITQAQDGEWGSDREDADTDVFSEEKTIGRLFLEQTCEIHTDATDEEYIDLMGDVLETQNAQVFSNTRMSRMDMDTYLIGEDEGEDDFAEDDNFIYQKQGASIIPALNDESEKLAQDAKAQYLIDIENATNEKEEEIALLLYEQRLDNCLSQELSLCFDSPFVGKGYTAPRRKHQFISIGQVSELTEAAEQREKFFYDLFSKACSCKSFDDLYGPLIGSERDFAKGFYSNIQDMYQHDKEINTKWSLFDRKNEAGEVVSESAWSIQRKDFIRAYRDADKDEESLRSALWAWFDRRQGEIPAVYKNGKLFSPSKKYKDAIWLQQRTQAFSKLFLTSKQWGAIYSALNLVKKRIELNKKSTTEEQDAMALLRKHFKRITNLDDLKAYRYWATKRKRVKKQIVIKTWTDELGRERKKTKLIDTYEFKKSMLDKMSIRNEFRWWKSVVKKQRLLQQRLHMFNHLDNSVKEVIPTTLDKVSVDCPDPKCNRAMVKVPVFAEIKDEKGFLFVECDCRRKIWLIDENQSGSDIKTFEELCKSV